MPRENEFVDRRLRDAPEPPDAPRHEARHPEQGEDWLLTSALLGGLVLALLFDTCMGLIPG